MSCRDHRDHGSEFSEPLDPAGGENQISAKKTPLAPGNPARLFRHRKGTRTDCCRGETLTIELRDARLVPATVLDESHHGLSLYVGDATLFRPTQAIFVRRRGVRNAAVIRYVLPYADAGRIGLRLYLV